MKTDRLIAIIMVLLERRMVKASELAEMFEVTPRTIYRDIEAINQAGVPIVAYPGPSGGIGIMESYKVEKRLFSTSDIAALIMGLGSVRSTLPSDAVTGALAKVKGMISQEQQREIERRAGQIKFDVTPWYAGSSLPAAIETIRLAMEQRRLLRFQYGDRLNRKSCREIEPYRLLLKGMDWYVQGYCLTRQDYRTFKILRISNIRVLDTVFPMRESALTKLDEPDFGNEKMVDATLRIHEGIRDQIIVRFGEDCLEPDGPDTYIARVHFPEDDWVCCLLLSFGDRCECLEPESMRERMRRILSEIGSLYFPGTEKT